MLKRVLLLCACLIILPGLSLAQLLPAGHSSAQSCSPVSLSAYVGWLDQSNGIALTTRLFEANLEFLDKNPLRGAWFEVTAQGSLSDRVGFLVSGGILAPSTTRGAELETVAGTATEYSLSGTSWGLIQGLMTYNLSNSFQVIGGFRWDHFNTRWNFSGSPSFLDFKLNAYAPLIGVQLEQRFVGGELIARIMGWPGVIPGHMTQTFIGGAPIPGSNHREQNPGRGYLMEFSTEYRRTLLGSTSAGVFLRWNALHVASDEGGYEGLVNNVVSRGAVTQSFDRKSLTIGGSLTFDFMLPDFL